MKTRSIQRVLVTAGIAVVVCLAGASPGFAQSCETDSDCPPGQVCGDGVCVPQCGEPGPGEVCVPVPDSESCFCFTPVPPGTPVPCEEPSPGGTPCAAVFTSTNDTWNLQFGTNNAIKLGTTVQDDCPGDSFVLLVQAFRITQEQYADREDPQFGDTVCNPTADPLGTPPLVPPSTDCVFYRLHGQSVSESCYPNTDTAWDYSIFWNFPAIQGNKHDWMLLRARCSESLEHPDPICDDTQLFSENTTVMVEKKPPVGFDPVVRGTGDGISDFIVAISTKHPHKIPPLIIP